MDWSELMTLEKLLSNPSLTAEQRQNIISVFHYGRLTAAKPNSSYTKVQSYLVPAHWRRRRRRFKLYHGQGGAKGRKTA